MKNKKIKQKIWIQKRVFLSFFIFTMLILNVFALSIYFFTIKNIEKKSQVVILDKNLFWNSILKIEKTENLSDLEKFQKDFVKFLFILNFLLIFLTFIFSYLITKKSLRPLLDLSKFLDDFDFKWKNSSNSKKFYEFENFYWDSEFWKLISSINKFISQNKKILDSQINFIQDVNHELKTPLMQIESNLEIIENKIKDKRNLENIIENIIEKLNQIWNSTKNINEIISNLWFILRWEKILKKKENINLEKYFLNLIEKNKILAEEKNLKIILEKEKNLEEKELEIQNNEYYLDRLFWNLLSNAIFYNNSWKLKKSKIFIKIWKNFVKIIDKWIWIEQLEIEKIFDRFYRSPNSWVFYENWNWLWLIIVKKICNLFWWKIEVKSEIWKWSEFKIIF